MTATKPFAATIDRVNDHGFTTVEQPGVWKNLSKYADPQPIIPEPGTVVTVTLDGSGFVRTIEPTDQMPLSAPRSPAAPAGGRDRVITRLSVLKSAARFACSRPDASSDDVLTVAERWVSWVERD